jgi:hypothetical protein
MLNAGDPFQTPPRQERLQLSSDAASAPDESDMSGTKTDSVSRSLMREDHDAMQTQPSLTRKAMKKTSMAAQFFTTIVLKSCIACREWQPMCASSVRASYIFEKVEVGLRDRTLYPLPPDVSLQELLKNSYFHDCGNDAEELFQTHVVDRASPLNENMIKHGNGLYENKFCDSRKILVNRALPRFLQILKKNTGSGMRSG